MARAMTVCVLAMAACCVAAGKAQADEIQEIGKDGHRTGKNLVIDQQIRGEASYNGLTRTVTLPDGTRIALKDLFPGDDAAEVSRLEGLYNAEEGDMERATQAKRGALEREQSSDGQAYRLTRELAAKPRRDMDGEPVFDVAHRVARGQVIEGLEDAFPDCTTTKRLVNFGTKPVLATQQVGCQRLSFPDRCTHVRNMDAASVQGEYVSDEQVQADLTYAVNVRDYLNGFVGGTVTANLSWSGTVGNVTLAEAPTPANAYHASIAIEYDTEACDPATAACPAQDAHITLALEGSVVAGGDIASAPPECLEGNDGFCEATWTCTEGGPRMVNGVWIDESMAPLLPRLYAGEPPSQLCWVAEARYTCTYPTGEVCGEGAGSGGQMCETVGTENTQANACATLEATPTCTKIKSACAPNALSAGFCYVQADTYSCRRDGEAPIIAEEKTFACNTPIRCMGSECLSDDFQPDGTSEARLDHQEQLGLAQHALADYAPLCAGPPCRLFIGENLRCHRATGGTLNFCTTDSDPQAKSLYLDWYATQLRRSAAIAIERDDTGPEHGAWLALRDSANWNADTALRSSLTSVRETIRSDGESPAREPVANPSTQEQFEDMLGQEAYLSWLPKVYGRFVRTVQLPTSGWEGSAEEYELFRKRGLHQCIHVGDYCESGNGTACPSVVESYCCFSTALSKAVHEHLGTEFGDPRSPTCNGGIDTSISALLADTTFHSTEWTAMQTFAGRQPSLGTADSMGSYATLTGTANPITLSDQTRTDLVSRTQQMTSGLRVGEIHARVGEELQALVPDAVADPTDAGTVSFSPALYFGGDRPTVVVSLSRKGSRGAVSARWTVTTDVLGTPIVVSPQRGSVSWADGESGTKHITLDVNQANLSATALRQVMRVDSTSGGLGIGVRPDATLLLKSAQ